MHKPPVDVLVITEDYAESPGHAKTLASEEDPNFIGKSYSYSPIPLGV